MTEEILSNIRKKDYQIISEKFAEIANVISIFQSVEPDERKLEEDLITCFERSGFIGVDGNLKTMVTKTEQLLAHLGMPGTEEQFIEKSFSRFHLPILVLVLCLSFVGYSDTQSLPWLLLRMTFGSSVYCLLSGILKFQIQKRYFESNVTTSMIAMHTASKTVAERVFEHGFPKYPLVLGIIWLSVFFLDYLRSVQIFSETTVQVIFIILLFVAWNAISWVSKRWSSRNI